MKEKNNLGNLKKDFIWNTIGSTLNAFQSLIFMIIVTRINGVSDAGIFTFAFSTATLFYIIGVYSGRVYQVTDRENTSDKDYFYNKVLSCLLMFLVSVIFIIFKGYTIYKSSIILFLCILKLLEALSEYTYAYFQKNYYLYRVGISLTIKTILCLTVFLIIDILIKNILISSISIIIIYLLIMLIYDLRYIDMKKIKEENSSKKNVFSIFVKGFFTFALSFLTMYIINIPRYAIDSHLADKYSTIFGILIMPASVMVLFAQFVLQPLIMRIKNDLESNNYKDLKKIITSIIGILLLFGIISQTLAYLLGIPVLEFIYNIPLSKYKSSLMIVLIGATMYSIVVCISNILISMRITFPQVIIYTVACIISLILSNILVNNNGILGACTSYSIIMSLIFICFISLIIYSIYKKEREKKNG